MAHEIRKILSGTNVAFILLFVAIALASMQLTFKYLLGSSEQSFNYFQFFGPIAGIFLGPLLGAFTVLIAESANLLINPTTNALTLLRVLPMLFAAYYFGSNWFGKKFSLAVSLGAIAVFLLHPVGREAWFFTLIWLIPFVAKLFPNWLFVRSLGATYTAHAVGGAIWIWTFPTTAAYWATLLPLVLIERMLFAGGITTSYILANTVLAKLGSIVPRDFISIDRHYVLSRKWFGLRN